MCPIPLRVRADAFLNPRIQNVNQGSALGFVLPAMQRWEERE